MEADDGGFVVRVEMAGDGVAHHASKFFHAIALRENGMAERSGLVAVLGGFLDDKDDFLVSHEPHHLRSL